MLLARERSICGARNAFVPGAALLALTGDSQFPKHIWIRPEHRAAPPAPAQKPPSLKASYTSSSVQRVAADTLQGHRDAGRLPRGVRRAAPGPRRSPFPQLKFGNRSSEYAGPFPPIVDYEQEKEWLVSSDVTVEKRLRRIEYLAKHLVQASERDTSTQALQKEDLAEDEVPRLPGPLVYEGCVVRTTYPGKISSAEIGWLQHSHIQARELGNITSKDRLASQIRHFVDSVLPNEAERAAREAAVADVKDVISRVVPDCGLEIFGSERTGLSIATSDLDLRLFPPPDQRNEHDTAHMPPTRRVRADMLQNMFHLLQVFKEAPEYVFVFFRHGRYPLINMIHEKTGVEIQIVCSKDTTNQRNMMTGYLTEFPALKDLFILVKVLFDIRGLADVFGGGMSSYGVFMMVVAALKIQRQRGGIVKGDDAADCLQHFLQFWSELDTIKYGVKIEPPEVFEKRVPDPPPVQQSSSRRPIGTVDPRRPYLLCLIDPADSLNDLGRKCSCIKHILATLRFLNFRLTTDMASLDALTLQASSPHFKDQLDLLRGRYRIDAKTHRPIHMGYTSLLFPMVGASHYTYLDMRKKMEAFGLGGSSTPLDTEGPEVTRSKPWVFRKIRLSKEDEASDGYKGREWATPGDYEAAEGDAAPVRTVR